MPKKPKQITPKDAEYDVLVKGDSGQVIGKGVISVGNTVTVSMSQTFGGNVAGVLVSPVIADIEVLRGFVEAAYEIRGTTLCEELCPCPECPECP